ncbi:cation transporter [Fusibacter paucivorans]|uniref:Cation transporter n=1 Tax=Fusibacter paucivorans TaxID=76009 RepID=A0ABS5PMU3_9FIRM|nr:cation diffusion facilitator family transporter [Fusibacter paucivorans]MBS7526499.1 cation transporter [Fusibacter paucivorans]
MKKELLRSRAAKKITLLGFWANGGLTFFKLVAGYAGHSQAMLADGIHSLSDFLTDIVVLIGFKITEKPEDDDHTYGHGKYETLATIIISIMLAVVGYNIFKAGVVNIYGSFHGEVIPPPEPIALLAAAVSIVVKEYLYRRTSKVANQINSAAVKANAWHHRSDAFSSMGTSIGIGGAMLLGHQWTILDPIASVIVSVFILKVAFEIFMPALNELMESALPQEKMNQIRNILEDTPAVITYHEIRARKLGNRVAIEFHIMVEENMKITQAHDIATHIEEALFEKFGQDSIITIHLEPYIHEEYLYYLEKEKEKNAKKVN